MVGNAEVVARRYFALVVAGDAEALAAMYAPDGYLDLPDGGRIPGRAAVSDFYRFLFRQNGAKPEILSALSDGRRCDVEILAIMPDGKAQRAIDCFVLDDVGLIASLTVYTRASLTIAQSKA